MTRNSTAVLAIALLSACASSQPPLLEQDGQSRASRTAQTEAIERQRALQRQLAAEQARQATMTAELPPALTNQPAIPAPTRPAAPPVAPGATDLDMAALEAVLDEATAQPSLPPPPSIPPSAVVRRGEPTAMRSATPYPELSPAAPIRPLNAPTPPVRQATSGPYFSSEGPAQLPPTRTQEPVDAVEGSIVAPRIVGAAAPSAMATTAPPARPTVRPQANGRPQALNQPFTSAPVAAPAVTARAPVATSTEMTPPQVQTLQQAAARRAMIRVNTLRAQNGLEPLAYSQDLSQIAQAQVMHLAQTGTVSAVSPEGHSVGTRLMRQGYETEKAASLVAGGYGSFDAALDSWLSNPVEASRLMMPDATEFGFAVLTEPGSTYRTYIEAIIARR